MNDNLNTPRGLALVWDLLKDNEVSEADKKATILDFDKVLGLGLGKIENVEIPKDVQKLVDDREKARKDSDWGEADRLRNKILKLGFEVKDTPVGPKISLK